MKGIVKSILCIVLIMHNCLFLRAEEPQEPQEIITGEMPAEETPLPEENTKEELQEETPAEDVIEEGEEPAEENEEPVPEETPLPEETPMPEPTPEPEEPTYLESAPQGAVQFVHNMYTAILHREPDEAGWETWVRKLTGGSSAADVILQFTNSVEFQNSIADPYALAQSLYQGILGREGSDAEVASWAKNMINGQTYRALLQGFILSAEFKIRCEENGLIRGSYRSPYAVDRNAKVTAFVMDLYRILLGRDAEFGGLENWTKKLLDKQTASQIITNIINSAEFQQKGLANKDYVQLLYKAVLGREGSASEVNGWAERMDNGQTYRAMMHGFINSVEFKNRCASIGIVPGTYTSSRYADQNYTVTLFVKTLFRKGLGREGSEKDIEYRAKQVLTKSVYGDALVRTFLNSAECRKRNLSNEDYVSMLYECVLGRSRKDATVGSSWVRKLNNGTARTTILNAFLSSAEFKKRCTALGLSLTPSSKSKTTVTVTQYVPWRYLQGDSRWGSVSIGGYTMARTGCVPTSIAMALSGILNRSVRPDSVAQWLYNNTQEYNRLMHGGSGAANKYAAEAWGVKVYGISFQSALVSALNNGYIVAAIVGPGTFTAAGTTHEIVLWGSSAGACNVYDPLGKTGKYSIASIWSQQSSDSYDWRGGYVFYAMYK